MSFIISNCTQYELGVNKVRWCEILIYYTFWSCALECLYLKWHWGTQNDSFVSSQKCSLVPRLISFTRKSLGTRLPEVKLGNSKTTLWKILFMMCFCVCSPHA